MKTWTSVAALMLCASPAFAGDNRNFLLPLQHWFNPIPLVFDRTDDTSIGEDDAVQGASERAVILAAGQTWADVACTDITFVDATTYDGGGIPASEQSFNLGNGISAVVFEQPCEPGVLAYNSRTVISGNTEQANGRTWIEIPETDTVFCGSVNFGTPAEIDSPQCVGEYDMQGIALHELGHGIGYAHTCEASESCGDPELQSAVMYWAVGACDGHQRAPNPYDTETHSISYGLGASSSFSVANGAGGLPLTVDFTPVVIASASVISATWSYGDGTASQTTAGPAQHTYEVEGRFTVQATILANAPACGGDFTQVVKKTNAVIACNDLEPEFHFSKDGKRVKFYSDTLGSAAGCLQILNWDFGDGGTANVKNPIHEYATSGDYTVTLTATGPSGTSAPFTKTVKVGGGGGGIFGCSIDGDMPTANTAAAAGALGIAVLMSLATVTRRRT